MPCHQEPLLGTAGKSQEALAHGAGGLWWSGLDGLTINIHQHPSTSAWLRDVKGDSYLWETGKGGVGEICMLKMLLLVDVPVELVDE